MVTYIRKDTPDGFVGFDEPLDPESFSDIGETLGDYYSGLWVPLSPEQAEFHERHPEASVSEVWDMAIAPVPERTLAEAVRDKLAEIERYDVSEEVNSFTLGGVRMWLGKTDRVGRANAIAYEEAAGRETTTLWSGTTRYVFPIETARRMLAELELYAIACYNVTAQHKATVSALETVEAVDSYDHTSGYPANPVFYYDEP